MIDFTDQVVLVTGAARGIGLSCAEKFAQAGASVIMTDVAQQVGGLTYDMATDSEMNTAAARIMDETGSRVVIAHVDVRKIEQLNETVELAKKEFGRLDVVVANAGIASWPTSTWQATEQQWQTMMDVTLTGTWNTCRAAIPLITEGNRGGSIIMVGSTAAVKPLPSIGHYAAAKNGLIGLLKSLALELAGQSIRVNAVHPGGTGTYMTENPAAELWQTTALGVGDALKLPMPIHRMEPEDISNAVRWLASSEARYITGAQLVIDAGATLQ